MKYTALYRHWRPKTFQEVVGQDPIIKTLKNQIKSERIAHAYLFCGSRGTGKTSTAKILAVAVNCLSPVDGDPCLECDVCKKLSSGNNMDVIEIDAASNNGVDEIRDLRDKVKFPPVVGRYKVYIIDEVHMLSMGAFNALLKTLEEPPDHVVFILATTEPHKLPATVLSRCQRYDFKRISINVMVQRLRSIAGEMGVDVEDSALQTIARWAEGGLRDALSLMDQCMGFCDKNITQQDVLSILGTADQQFVFQMVENILEGKRSNLLFQLDKLIEDGRDLSAFVRDIMQHLRGLLVTKICQDPAGLLDVTENTLEQYRKMASQTNEERLIRAVEALSALEGELRWSNQPRVLLELTLIKICRPEHENSLEALLDRIKTLEQHIASIGDAAGRTQSYAGESEHAAAVLPAKEQKNIHEQEPDTFRELSPDYQVDEADKANEANEVDEVDEAGKANEVDEAGEVEEKDLDTLWKEVLKTTKKERVAIYGMLVNARLQNNGSEVISVVFPKQEEFYVMAMEKQENRKYLNELISRAAGRKVNLKFRLDDAEHDTHDDDTHNDDNRDLVQEAADLFGEDLIEVVDR